MTQVFMWATGQDENIGDSLLRRPLLEFARTLGQTNVFIGPASPEFQTGLGLIERDRPYEDFRAWLAAAARSTLREPTLIVPNAGEVPISRRGAMKLASIASILRMPRASGLWLGAGVPGTASAWARPYAKTASKVRYAAFRDSDSLETLGSGTLMPDWAFSLGSPVTRWAAASERDLLTIVLRGDRQPPSTEWLSWIDTLAKRHSLRPTVIVQVHRDDDRAREVAKVLGGHVLEFPSGTSHADQESSVRDAYRRSLLTVGDRLHGLIVGATEGSVPLGWVESSRGKISRHFRTVGLDYVGASESSDVATYQDISQDQINVWQLELTRAIADARDSITSVMLQSANRLKEPRAS